MSNKIALSYHDSLLHESDLDLLDCGGWLNDRLIGFAYEYFEKELFNSNKRLAFVNPSTVQFLKLSESLDEAKVFFLDPLDLDDKDFIFFPLNDNNEVNSEGGSHWSLLLVDKVNSTFYHIDSMNGANNSEAKRFYEKYKKYFKANKLEMVKEFPRQQNSSDCGVYVLGNEF